MESPTYFTRLPESMELSDIGPYFRSLREHYNLSEHDVSARLHIRVKYIQAIETSDMSQLPGKVYARGYIATYAEFLGIDPEQAVERFLGSETKEKVEEYFVPEPARLDSGLQQKIRLGLVAAFVLAVLYLLIAASGDSEDESTVVPMPQALMESARSLVMPMGKSLRCVDGSVLAACLDSATTTVDAHPLQHPTIFTAPTPWEPAVIKPAVVQKQERVEPKEEAKPVKVVRPKPESKESVPSENADPNRLPWLRQ